MGEKLSIDEIERIIQQEGQGTIELLQDGTVRRLSGEEIRQHQKEEAEIKACASVAPHRNFIKELLDPRARISEREQAAVRLIGELATRLKAKKKELKASQKDMQEQEERVAEIVRKLKIMDTRMKAVLPNVPDDCTLVSLTESICSRLEDFRRRCGHE